jgi:hypothetical protein
MVNRMVIIGGNWGVFKEAKRKAKSGTTAIEANRGQQLEWEQSWGQCNKMRGKIHK